jgi:hypothetical protein
LDSLRNFAETPPKSDKLYLYLEQLQRWKEMSLQERDVFKKVRRALAPGLTAPIPGDLKEPPRGQMKVAPPAPGSEAQKDNAGEKRLNLNDLPAQVQDTIKASGGSLDLKRIRKVDFNGQLIYRVVLSRAASPLFCSSQQTALSFRIRASVFLVQLVRVLLTLTPQTVVTLLLRFRF